MKIILGRFHIEHKKASVLISFLSTFSRKLNSTAGDTCIGKATIIHNNIKNVVFKSSTGMYANSHLPNRFPLCTVEMQLHLKYLYGNKKNSISGMQIDSAVLYTADIEQAVSFYRDILELQLDFVDEDRFAQFSFANGVKLSIKKSTEDREHPGHQTIFITAEHIETLFEKMQKPDITIRKPLSVESWGKQFSIWDPDMNKIVFVSRK